MFTGEAEIQARRKILTVLQDESRKVLEGARDLDLLYKAAVTGDKKEIDSAMNRIRLIEEEVEDLRRGLARQLAEMGSIMLNREDILRAAYNLEALTAFFGGMAFRISHVNNKTISKGRLADPMKKLIESSLELMHRLNEVVRALAINPDQTWELAGTVQNLEREIDDKYRNLTIQILTEIKNIPEMILLKDIVERFEGMADTCLEATDAVTVLALGF